MGNRAMIDCFRAAIAYIGGLVEAVTSFPDVFRAGLIAGGAGSTLDVAQNDLAAHICFPAMISVNTKVVGVVKGTLMVPVTEAVKLYLF